MGGGSMIRKVLFALIAAAVIASAQIYVHVCTRDGRFYAYSAKTYVKSMADYGYVTNGLTHMWDAAMPSGMDIPIQYRVISQFGSRSYLNATNIVVWKDLIGTNDLNIITGLSPIGIPYTKFICYADVGFEEDPAHRYGYGFYVGGALKSGAWCKTIPTNECVTLEISFIPNGRKIEASQYNVYVSNGMCNEQYFTEPRIGQRFVNDIDRQHIIASVNAGAGDASVWQTSTTIGGINTTTATGILSVVSSPAAARGNYVWQYIPYFMANIVGWDNTYSPSSRPYSFWENGLEQPYSPPNPCSRTISHTYGGIAQNRSDFSSIGFWNDYNTYTTNYVGSSEDMHYAINSVDEYEVSVANGTYTGIEVGPLRLLPYFTVGFAYTFDTATKITETIDGEQYIRYELPSRENATMSGDSTDTEYYSIRCYNRVLTDQERRQNFLADTQRFRTVY